MANEPSPFDMASTNFQPTLDATKIDRIVNTLDPEIIVAIISQLKIAIDDKVTIDKILRNVLTIVSPFLKL